MVSVFLLLVRPTAKHLLLSLLKSSAALQSFRVGGATTKTAATALALELRLSLKSAIC